MFKLLAIPVMMFVLLGLSSFMLAEEAKKNTAPATKPGMGSTKYGVSASVKVQERLAVMCHCGYTGWRSKS